MFLNIPDHMSWHGVFFILIDVFLIDVQNVQKML